MGLRQESKNVRKARALMAEAHAKLYAAGAAFDVGRVDGALTNIEKTNETLDKLVKLFKANPEIR
jgi:predicted NAD/FAD-dependent oxidoreductase